MFYDLRIKQGNILRQLSRTDCSLRQQKDHAEVSNKNSPHISAVSEKLGKLSPISRKQPKAGNFSIRNDYLIEGEKKHTKNTSTI
jgi:hypothetical protein